MKLAAAGIALLLLASAGAEAGIFSSGSREKLPKPIDHPIVRPKVREDHKVGKKAGRHPAQYIHPTWGNEWNITLKARVHPIPDYLYQTQ